MNSAQYKCCFIVDFHFQELVAPQFGPFAQPLPVQEADVALNMPVLAEVVHNPPMAQFEVIFQYSNRLNRKNPK